MLANIRKFFESIVNNKDHLCSDDGVQSSENSQDRRTVTVKPVASDSGNAPPKLAASDKREDNKVAKKDGEKAAHDIKPVKVSRPPSAADTRDETTRKRKKTKVHTVLPLKIQLAGTR